jgi:hypothetical protein
VSCSFTYHEVLSLRALDVSDVEREFGMCAEQSKAAIADRIAVKPPLPEDLPSRHVTAM